MKTPDHADPAMRVSPAAEPPRSGTDDDAAGVEQRMTKDLYAEPHKPSERVGEGGKSHRVDAAATWRGSDGRKGSDNMSIMDILNALGVDLSEAKIVISQDEREITITPKGDAP